MKRAVYHCVVFSTLIVSEIVECADEDLHFPDGFSLGAAGASYQIEGAWNDSDKGENVWDWFTHNEKQLIFDGTDGDVACDSFHKYTEDVQSLKEIGFDHYRLSLSWSRILPTGFANKVSKDGIKYYNDLLDELHANGIEPFVTLYHWDHPQVIEEMGGWTNDLIVDWFADYARVVFRELGPKIKIFSTINEPYTFCEEGYASDTKAPGKKLDGIGNYLCGHNVLKAHASAYHIYDNEFRQTQNGSVGIIIPCFYASPKNPEDTTSGDIAFQFNCGWFGHPIYSTTGDYPEVMKERIAARSRAEGYPRSRLPEFSEEWKDYIRGTADYFGLNHYTTVLVEPASNVNETSVPDTGLVSSVDPNWPESASSWLRVVPFGFGNILRKINAEYNNPPVYVMENGVSDNGTMVDHQRINYFYSYIKEMLIAINRDGCNVKAYTAWSFMDNFEWQRGYTERFGILHVDFESPNRTRTAKESVKWWKQVLLTRELQPVPVNTTASVIIV